MPPCPYVPTREKHHCMGVPVSTHEPLMPQRHVVSEDKSDQIDWQFKSYSL